MLFNHSASAFSAAFVKRQREDGSSFYCLADASPKWMCDAVRLAHDGELPNDERYSLIRDAAIAISDQHFSDSEDAHQAVCEMAQDLCPYNAELLQWFANRTARLSDCDEAAAELGHGEMLGVWDLLEMGYRRAAQSVLSTLITEIEENRCSMFDPDTDSRLILSDSHGVYIPKLWADQLTEEDAEDLGVDWQDVLVCQSGPDTELYWEAWQQVLDSALIIDHDGSEWTLFQNGDLWEIRADVELPEDAFC